MVPIARSRLRSARLPLEDRRVIVAALATAAASGAGPALARAAPTRAAARPCARRSSPCSGMVPAMAALRDRDLAAYHGVEHKAIGAYEKGSLDPNDAPKEHERCGSNLIAPMLAFSVAGQVATERLLEQPGPVARAAAGTGAVSAAVEVFAYAERNPESPLGRAVHARRPRDPARCSRPASPRPSSSRSASRRSRRSCEEAGRLQDGGVPADTRLGGHVRAARRPCAMRTDAILGIDLRRVHQGRPRSRGRRSS